MSRLKEIAIMTPVILDLMGVWIFLFGLGVGVGGCWPSRRSVNTASA